MIQKHSAEHAYSLASHYAEKGLSVVAKPNSVLSEMVRLTNVTGVALGNGFQPSDPGIGGQLAEKLGVVSSGDADAPSDHDLFVDKTADQISKAVLAHISFAKNVVKPAVLDVGAAIDKAMQFFKAENPEASITIKEFDTPKLVDDMGLSQELERYSKASIIVPDSTCAHGAKSYEEILPLLLTGDQDTDEAVAHWYSTLDH